MRQSGSARVGRAELEYLAGNSLVIIVGLMSGYIALRVSNSVPAQVLSQRTSDFLQYYSAGHEVIAGHAADAYRWTPMLNEEQAIAYPYRVPVNVFQPFFIYPPIAALLFAFFALLPYDVARFVWFIVSAVALAASLLLLERTLGLTGRAAAAFRFAAIIFLPVFQTLFQGQVTGFLLLAFAAAAAFLVRGEPLLAGVSLSVVTVKPQLLVVVLPVLLVRGRWKVLAAFTAAVVVEGLVALVVLGPATTAGYLRVMLALPTWGTTSGLMLNGAGESLYGLAHALLAGRAADLGWFVAAVVVLVASCLYAWVARGAAVPFVLAVIGGLLISPHLILYDLTLLLLPAVTAWGLARSKGVKLVPTLLLFYFAVVAALPVELLSPVRLSPLVMLALGGVLVWLDRTQPSALPPSLAPVPVPERGPDR